MDDFDDFMLSIRDDGTFDAIEDPGYSLKTLEPIREKLMVEVEEDFHVLKRWYRLDQLTQVEKLWDRKQFPATIEAIRSMVGDDETITTNCLIYAILCIIIGPRISQIIISWDDVGFNRNMYNYAEGWILLPPSMDSDFESVTRYNRGNGVPFVLDPVKFKDLSCVRKQSNMEEDLASKFKSLAERAAWTHPSWPTWNMHQYAMILGIEIFDFMKAKVFPYLFDTEGGCGGSPPWNNMYTASAAMFRYRSGKAMRGIVGIMSDANRLQRGEIRPEEAFYTKNLNLAMSGDKRWESVRSYIENEKHESILAGEIWEPNIVKEADETIPQPLLAKATTINPDDAYTGVAISFLREKGYILTEFDLVMRVENEKRLKALWGHVPMRDIEDQIELRKSKYKDAYLETLSELSRLKLGIGTQNERNRIEDPFSPETISIMMFYYRTRVEQALNISSFIYNERVRIFKLDDVETYFNRGNQGIKDRFCQSVGSYYRPEHRRSIQLPWEQRTFNEIEEWLRSGDLKTLLSQPIPAGVGPDDSRIVRDLLAALQVEAVKFDGVVILLITGDRRLTTSTQRIVAHSYPDLKLRVCSLRIRDYLVWCTLARQRPSFIGPKAVPPYLKRNIFNPFQGKGIPIHGPLLNALVDQFKFLWGTPRKRLLIEYDYPNINRALARFKLHRNNFVEEYTGGYLTSGYLGSDPHFVTRPIDDLLGLDEFSRLKRRAYYGTEMLKRNNLQLVSATSYTTSEQLWE
jgi:hypothetical protein